MAPTPIPELVENSLAVSSSKRYTSINDEDASRAIEATRKFAKEYMGVIGDPSHDWSHVERVLKLALEIANEESPNQPRSWPGTLPNTPLPNPINRNIVILAALLHDVGDKKYLPYIQDAFNRSSAGISNGWKLDFTKHDDGSIAFAFLNDYTPLTTVTATAIQAIVDHVSYSKEMSLPPGRMQELLMKLPELAIVQDADRLDALGVVGLGRCFSYNAAEIARKTKINSKELNRALDEQGVYSPRTSSTRTLSARPDMEDILERSLAGGLKPALDHIDEKLLKLESTMKTQTGRKLARERTIRLGQMKKWFSEEIGMGI